MTIFEDVESRPLVGSSRNSMIGSATNSKPTFTLLRCPPEMPRTSSSPMISFLMSSNAKICAIQARLNSPTSRQIVDGELCHRHMSLTFLFSLEAQSRKQDQSD
ncbi:MAG: hypothetical protein FRX49_13280 [Trebouxia sp. A1-2]|nr:MAG: hypothetical protein FRX49_13280 [Trebouxia sp. A1-2]